MKAIQWMDGAQQMGSMELYHEKILDHKIFFQIPQVDLHREGKEKRPSYRRKRPS
jgi:hypothetical protein